METVRVINKSNTMTKLNGKDLSKVKGAAFRFKPLSKRIYIKRISKEITTPGGIIIPSNSEGLKVPRAEVIAVSVDCQLGIRVGDMIYFNPQMITAVYHPDYIENEEEYFVTHENNIEGIIDPRLSFWGWVKRIFS